MDGGAGKCNREYIERGRSSHLNILSISFTFRAPHFGSLENHFSTAAIIPSAHDAAFHHFSPVYILLNAVVIKSNIDHPVVIVDQTYCTGTRRKRHPLDTVSFGVNQ